MRQRSIEDDPDEMRAGDSLVSRRSGHSKVETMKSRVLKFCAAVCYWAGLLPILNRFVNRVQPAGGATRGVSFPFLKRRRSRPIQILTYHRVNDDRDSFFPGMPASVFSDQMSYLAKRYHVCSLVEATGRLLANDVPENAVVVTFDDGYRDNYSHAFPILKAHGVSATIFLATGAVGTGQMLWHDQVFTVFRETQCRVLTEYHPDLPAFPLRTIPEKLQAQHSVLRMLRLLNEEERCCWITRLAEKLAVAEYQQDSSLMLTWEQVREMRGAGISFGAHTVSHPILSRLTREQMRIQIERSSADIVRNIGERPLAFAYPNGGREDFTGVTKELLRNAGFVCAVTTLFGANAYGQDPFELRRGQPWEEHLPTFATKLSWYRFTCPSP